MHWRAQKLTIMAGIQYSACQYYIRETFLGLKFSYSDIGVDTISIFMSIFNIGPTQYWTIKYPTAKYNFIYFFMFRFRIKFFLYVCGPVHVHVHVYLMFTCNRTQRWAWTVTDLMSDIANLWNLTLLE
jgi:hypothetical protein